MSERVVHYWGCPVDDMPPGACTCDEQQPVAVGFRFGSSDRQSGIGVMRNGSGYRPGTGGPHGIPMEADTSEQREAEIRRLVAQMQTGRMAGVPSPATDMYVDLLALLDHERAARQSGDGR